MNTSNTKEKFVEALKMNFMAPVQLSPSFILFLDNFVLIPTVKFKIYHVNIMHKNYTGTQKDLSISIQLEIMHKFFVYDRFWLILIRNEKNIKV